MGEPEMEVLTKLASPSRSTACEALTEVWLEAACDPSKRSQLVRAGVLQRLDWIFNDGTLSSFADVRRGLCMATAAITLDSRGLSSILVNTTVDPSAVPVPLHLCKYVIDSAATTARGDGEGEEDEDSGPDSVLVVWGMGAVANLMHCCPSVPFDLLARGSEAVVRSLCNRGLAPEAFCAALCAARTICGSEEGRDVFERACTELSMITAGDLIARFADCATDELTSDVTAEARLTLSCLMRQPAPEAAARFGESCCSGGSVRIPQQFGLCFTCSSDGVPVVVCLHCRNSCHAGHHMAASSGGIFFDNVVCSCDLCAAARQPAAKR